ncbi:uncharacterized protein G2W53_013663 [Senna tora]|uniref:Uncharacterized protein n=1 Tax=Senna tora TaxID=362788 RepID=A0A834TZA5_9FABA|nr:uncharacterized protein G2W53_013663 [Senna tora]
MAENPDIQEFEEYISKSKYAKHQIKGRKEAFQFWYLTNYLQILICGTVRHREDRRILQQWCSSMDDDDDMLVLCFSYSKSKYCVCFDSMQRHVVLARQRCIGSLVVVVVIVTTRKNEMRRKYSHPTKDQCLNGKTDIEETINRARTMSSSYRRAQEISQVVTESISTKKALMTTA